jgi:hypothetical protein
MWVTQNPLGTDVGVATETYESHIIGDHPDDKAREFVNDHVKGVIEQPRYIYLDNKHEENQRVKYIDYVALPEYGKIQSLIVVVDTDRTPNEIVTWSVRSETRKETGGIIYDSRKNKTESN